MHNKFYLNLNNLKSTQKILENFLKGFCCKRKFKATKGLNKIYLDFENSKLYFANFERHENRVLHLLSPKLYFLSLIQFIFHGSMTLG